MRSSIDVEPECLADIIAMLKQFGVTVTGSKEAEGVVCLIIEGDIVPDQPKVKIGVNRVIGSTIATLTATCLSDDM